MDRRGKYIRTDATKKKMSEARKGNKLSTETKRKIKESMMGKNKGKSHSEETKRNIGIANTKDTNDCCDCHINIKAWKLFGKDHCEVCGRSLEDNIKETGKRFDIHCMSDPKDYTIMTKENWKCVCSLTSKNPCHRDLEK